MQEEMAPLLPDLNDKKPEYYLVQILQKTLLLLEESGVDIWDRKSMHVLNLALLDTIDDLAQVDANTQVIQSESSVASEPSSNDRQERMQAVLRELEQNLNQLARRKKAPAPDKSD